MAKDKKKSLFGRLTGSFSKTDKTQTDASNNAPSLDDTTTQSPSEDDKELSWYERLKGGLARSSSTITRGISSIFTQRKLDDEMLQDLEDILIQSDLGIETASRITEQLASERYDKAIEPDEVRKLLADEVTKVLAPVAQELVPDPKHKPHVMLVVGVNGAGKTTTIGKLSHKFVGEGHKVMLAAGDTFRAAAIEQLKVWGQRTNCPVISRDIGSDASGLAYDAMEQATEAQADILMMDTAGRLQNKDNLMAELEKIIRVIKKIDKTAPHSVLLVLDATTGQNAIQQVEVFGKVAGVTGIIMTKLDGTARGGILVSIAQRFSLPIHAIGIGESIDDLQHFDASEFAKALSNI